MGDYNEDERVTNGNRKSTFIGDREGRVIDTEIFINISAMRFPISDAATNVGTYFTRCLCFRIQVTMFL